MTAPASTAALDAVAQMVYQLVTNPAMALQFAQDGSGTAAVQGLTDLPLDQVNMQDAVAQA